MNRIITPEQAQALITGADGYADPEYTELDLLLDTNPSHLQRLAWRMAEQIANACTEWRAEAQTVPGGMWKAATDWESDLADIHRPQNIPEEAWRIRTRFIITQEDTK